KLDAGNSRTVSDKNHRTTQLPQVNEHGGEDFVGRPTPAVNGVLHFCRSAFVLNRTEAELLPKPARHPYG
ncbi:MAG: hypothetical protein WBQ12_15830, partial [Candidatus Sulfotelmatobacter sp.]